MSCIVIQVDEEKLEAKKNYSTRTNASEVRFFLRLTSLVKGFWKTFTT